MTHGLGRERGASNAAQISYPGIFWESQSCLITTYSARTAVGVISCICVSYFLLRTFFSSLPPFFFPASGKHQQWKKQDSSPRFPAPSISRVTAGRSVARHPNQSSPGAHGLPPRKGRLCQGGTSPVAQWVTRRTASHSPAEPSHTVSTGATQHLPSCTLTPGRAPAPANAAL